MKFGELENALSYQVKIFFWGMLDALSFHKTIPELVNNPIALSVFGRILAANGGLILGSIFLFHKGISPLLDVIGQSALDLQNKQHFDSLMWFVYRWLWLGPVCGLCYACCLAWYNELGASLKKGTVEKSTSKQINESLYGIYGLLVWLIAFLQLQLLNGFIPSFIDSLVFTVDKVIAIDLLKQILIYSIRFLGGFNQTLNYLLMTTLYAWYAFDPTWIAQGVNPDERFSRIHRHLAYFLGFGLPFTILNKNTSFFIGFSTFLMVFPLSIILGSKLDYTSPYKEYDVKPVAAVEVFKPAQLGTLYLLRPFNKKRGAGTITSSSTSMKEKAENSVEVSKEKDSKGEKEEGSKRRSSVIKKIK